MTVCHGPGVLALLLVAASAWGSAIAGPPELANAWMRPAPAGSEQARAYVDIASEAALQLTGASTPLAQHVEIVVVPTEGDASAETAVQTLPIPKGATRLAYRGNHLRLTGIRWDAGNGQRIPLTLRFRDVAGAEVTASTDILVRGILMPRQVPVAEQAARETAPAPSAENPPPGTVPSPPAAPPMTSPASSMSPAQPRM